MQKAMPQMQNEERQKDIDKALEGSNESKASDDLAALKAKMGLDKK